MSLEAANSGASDWVPLCFSDDEDDVIYHSGPITPEMIVEMRRSYEKSFVDKVLNRMSMPKTL
jgi:hypothetical protein